MQRLRPYKDADAEYIIKWMEDESSFVKWCANHFQYPLTLEELHNYKDFHDKDEKSLLFTAVDENGVPMGHILFDKIDYSENSVHFGHVIVDPKVRGNGLGKEMLKLALQNAFDILGFSKATLAVFDNNGAAFSCYKKIGFREYKFFKEVFPFHEEKWGCYYMQIMRGDFDPDKF
ncbi:MAG: GNAT family protein [Bacillota bacterium]|nr:GNAT family protein [Bacillota bacterium]